MKIFGINISIGNKEPKEHSGNLEAGASQRGAYTPRTRARTGYFDGEKTPGELGELTNLLPNHQALRSRAFEAQLKSDIVKIITGKFFKWVIGSGLKLQTEPNIDVLATEGIEGVDLATFRKNVEARFSVYAGSKMSDYKKMDNLHKNAMDAFYTAFLGGDSLCILRIDDDSNVNIQVVDGEHVRTPLYDQELIKAVETRGNTIRHGVELSQTGEHVAYFISVLTTSQNVSDFGKFERIPARGANSGKVLAWMQYGDKHRIDNVRGIPIITQILEKVDKLDRYTEATVGSAEERAKVVYSITHNRDSDGENPLLEKVRTAAGLGNNAAQETSGYATGEKTAERIAATTSKQTFNMPVGAKLESLASNSEIQYGSFSKAVFVFICASVDIPSEVALQLYEQNYSSSRAAINGWDYIVRIYRQRFAEKFYQNFYNLWLELQILNNKIQAPGFLDAMRSGNFMVVESYSKARFTGANMPHIDPLKEVNAVRKMLGNDTDPLISRDQAVELLTGGDWEKNIEKYTTEQDLIPEIPTTENEPDNSENRQ